MALMRDSQGTPGRPLRLRRRVALLGGTTSRREVVLAARHVLRWGGPASGGAVTAYEEAFASRLGVRHAVSFATGRVALYAVLRALGVGAGDEVLVPVPTHVVVPNAVLYTGARPVFVDCRLDTFGMDPELAERALTPRTRVLLLQHTFGIPAHVERLRELARAASVDVVEDCVHALGAEHAGRPVGSFGKAAFFSTEETKTISTTMGGMAATDDDELAASLRRTQAACAWPRRWLTVRYLVKLIAYHVATEPRVHRWTRAAYERAGRRNPLPGPTSEAEKHAQRPADYLQRLSPAQAALGLSQLRGLDSNLEHRRRIAGTYARGLAAVGVRWPRPLPDDVPGWLRYPVWVDDRSAAVEALRGGMVPGTWFTSPLEEAADPALAGYVPGSCPRAEAAAQHLINLSTHGRVQPADADAAIRALRPFLPAATEPCSPSSAVHGDAVSASRPAQPQPWLG